MYVKLNYFDNKENEVFKCDEVKGPDAGFLLLYANTPRAGAAEGAPMNQKVKVVNLSRIESFEIAIADSMPEHFNVTAEPKSSKPQKI